MNFFILLRDYTNEIEKFNLDYRDVFDWAYGLSTGKMVSIMDVDDKTKPPMDIRNASGARRLREADEKRVILQARARNNIEAKMVLPGWLNENEANEAKLREPPMISSAERPSAPRDPGTDPRYAASGNRRPGRLGAIGWSNPVQEFAAQVQGTAGFRMAMNPKDENHGEHVVMIPVKLKDVYRVMQFLTELDTDALCQQPRNRD